MAVAIAWLPGPAGTRRRVAKPSVEEPDAAEPARPDLWGARVRNDPGLPDPDPLTRYQFIQATTIFERHDEPFREYSPEIRARRTSSSPAQPATASPLGRGHHRRGRRPVRAPVCPQSRRQVFPDVGFNGTPLLDDVGTTITLDFLNDDPDLPRRFFSVRWTGYWYAPEAGDVELHGAGERREYNTVRPHSALGYRPPAPKAISPTPRSGLIMSPALS